MEYHYNSPLLSAKIIMKKIIPYPSIQTLDTNSTRSWSDGNNYQYYFEEKIDGSQLSMMIESDNKIGFYNKNKPASENNSAFTKSILMLRYKYTNGALLNPNYIYHGESVCKIKHNVNVYERTPKNYFILYDIYDMENNSYLSPDAKKTEAERIGLEMVSILYHNTDPTISPYVTATNLIKQIESGEIISCLGGVPEGIVLKHHAFNQNGKIVATKLKYVTNIFKERHAVKQPKTELSADDFLNRLGTSFNTEARFHKAYQHLAEDGKIDLAKAKRSDLDKIIGELNVDFDKEYQEEIMLLLWLEFSPVLKKLARENVCTWFTDNFLPEEKEKEKNNIL